VAAELDVATDWILDCGAPEQKDAWIDMLRGFITGIDPNTLYDGGFERSVDIAWYWPEWIMWCAARTQDVRLLPALEELHARLSPSKADTAGPFLSRVEAACGSPEAIAVTVRQVLDDAAGIVSAGQAPGTGGIISLDNFYYSPAMVPQSLRVRIIHRRGLACAVFPMPAADATIRLALSDENTDDWCALYLLGGIKKLQARDRERLLAIWDSGEAARQMLALDVLYAWGDARLALLKRLAADDTIHAGMRFDLLGVDYGGTDWGLPLLEKAARDILATDLSATTVARIQSMMKSVGNSGFVIDPAAN
jgi:hypothetical protein